MTVAAIFAVLWPLARRADDRGRGGTDIAVYRDQIEEVRRDLAAGLIGEQEAAAAEREVSRRLIAAADASAAETVGTPRAATAWRRRAAAVLVLLLLPIGAGGLYLALGSPTLPDRPLAGRLAASPGGQSIDSLVAQIEAHLEAHPQDGTGWEVIAPVY